MEPAVEVVLTGVFDQFTPRASLKTGGFRGFKSSRKPAFQAGASPQQAESLAAAVRTKHICLVAIINLQFVLSISL